MMFRPVIFAALVAMAGAAQAADKPLYAQAPDWVKPTPLLTAAASGDDAPLYLIYDNQQRLKDGQVWTYAESATRAASSDVLSAIGTINLPWQPAKGDLIIHKVEIIRGTEHIDLLAGAGDKFSVLRREQNLEQMQLNGLLTATMQVEGLRVGDVLHMAFSVTQADATLKGNVQAFAPLVADPFKVGFARARMLWPVGSDVKWKTFGAGAKPVLTEAGGFHELTVTMPLPKQPDMPADAPMRFRRPTLLEASSFADWRAVSKVMAPLYQTDGLIAPGSPLAAEVAKIKAAESDPLKRAELALQLVQQKVRYLFNGMDNGNYVPQAPTLTWSARYGDCKAKTLLLLTLLHALDIEAEPVLASIGGGDLVADSLPAPGTFNHVLVRATIGGDALWLDGTDSGAQLGDIHDTPPFREVLPVRAAGADLMPLTMRPSARPALIADVELDESAGLNLPTPYKAKVTVRGQIAQRLRAAAPQVGKDDLTQLAQTFVKSYTDNASIVSRALTFDDVAGTATISASGMTYPNWTKEEERYRADIDHSISTLGFNPDRARAAWRDIPVSTGNPEDIFVRTVIHLPDDGKGFALDGDQTIAGDLFGVTIDRHVSQAGALVTVEDRMRSIGAEIPVDQIAAERQQLARAQTHLLRVLAPADYPPRWKVVDAARKGHRFDAALAVLKQGIADQPDQAAPLLDRSWFYERTMDWHAAITDATSALAIQPDADTYFRRARLYRTVGETDKAVADIEAARKIDPSSAFAIAQFAALEGELGTRDKALALLDERIDSGGKDKPDFLSAKAQLLADTGEGPNALQTIDSAITANPGNPALLNARCWLKGTLNAALDTALKDCTKSIELSDVPEQALDSRAMVYFRMNRMDDALADLNAALDRDPDLPASLYMRGIVRKRMGDGAAAATDLAGARLMAPTIDKTYARYGIAP